MAAVSDAVILGAEPPKTLSEFGFFADGARQVPAPGVTPFALNTPLFTDYAEKYRFVYLPPGAKAQYRENEVFEFPVGTALIKTFAYASDLDRPYEDIRLIETRVLLHQEQGWVAYPYVWSDNQKDAELKRAGATIDLTVKRSDSPLQIRYGVPNVNQCKGCHIVGAAMSPLGPKARNLNGDFAYASGTENQLAHWTKASLLAGAPDPAKAPRVPRFDDPGDGTLEARARAYLDVNCAHCHSAAGPANTSGLLLDFNEKRRVHWGVKKRPVAAGRGSLGFEFAIDPGHPERSFLLGRMKSNDPGVMMPELGRTIVHEEGVALIEAWIADLR